MVHKISVVSVRTGKFPENFHRDEPFHLNSPRNFRVFHTHGKRSRLLFKKTEVKPVVGFMGVGIEAGWSSLCQVKTKEVATIKDVPTK